MPRANRYHVPGLVWHITHRCHKREFLLKFARDRKRWQHWLFEAQKRFDLGVLNYAVTSNHIHLLVEEGKIAGALSKGIQLIAGRTGQEYNRRKGRRGAFWEDRYHATAVEYGEHLRRCMAYIDMNMVRAGAVKHPKDWADGGYCAIQNPPQRYRVVDLDRTALRLGYSGGGELQREQRRWVRDAIEAGGLCHRNPTWSESLAVGDRDYVEKVEKQLGMRSRFREVEEQDGTFIIREKTAPYNVTFRPENNTLSAYFEINNA